LHGSGKGFEIELGGGARGEADQDTELRLRTPDALSERGRDELTGTKDSELVSANGSGGGTSVKAEDEAMSPVEGPGATRVCDCDMGVPSASDSLSADEDKSTRGVEARVMSRDDLFGLKSGMTKRWGGSA
jgi:hypothetical protein